MKIALILLVVALLPVSLEATGGGIVQVIHKGGWEMTKKIVTEWFWYGMKALGVIGTSAAGGAIGEKLMDTGKADIADVNREITRREEEKSQREKLEKLRREEEERVKNEEMQKRAAEDEKIRKEAERVRWIEERKEKERLEELKKQEMQQQALVAEVALKEAERVQLIEAKKEEERQAGLKKQLQELAEEREKMAALQRQRVQELEEKRQADKSEMEQNHKNIVIGLGSLCGIATAAFLGAVSRYCKRKCFEVKITREEFPLSNVVSQK